ncbi:MAG: GtrA family protein [Legionella sp.]|nr:GtrA family protein [Legionella sp.]
MKPTHSLKKQFLGFTITGVFSTGIMYLIYLALNRWLSYQLAYAISYAISVLALYFMNTLFIFKQGFSMKTFLKFPLIYLIQYLIGAISLEFLVRHGVSEVQAPILIIVLLLPLTFFLNRYVLLK